MNLIVCVIVALAVVAFVHAQVKKPIRRPPIRRRTTPEPFPYAFDPASFSVGVSSDGALTEGAWNIDDKLPNVLDTLGNKFPDRVLDGSNANEATDSFHQYKADCDCVKNMSMAHYTVTINWRRVMGDASLFTYSAAGIEFYNAVVNYCRGIGLEIHFRLTRDDMPQALADIGGWTNPLSIKYFEVYADVMYYNFADRVFIWGTFFDAGWMSNTVYGNGRLDPVVKPFDPRSRYESLANVLKAHATVYRLYHYRYGHFGGQIAMCVYGAWYYSATNNTYDVDKAKAAQFDSIVYPIYYGDFSPVLREMVLEGSLRDGFNESVLPVLSQFWQTQLTNCTDLLAITFETSVYVETVDTKPQYGRFSLASPYAYLRYSTLPQWKHSATDYIYYDPEGLRFLLNDIRIRYGNPPMYITKIGWSDDGRLDDFERIEVYRGYFKQMLLSIYEDECNLVGVSMYSLLDQWEGPYGYTTPFGVFSTTNDANKTRIPKASSRYLAQVSSTGRP